ncbi:MAG: hypothetical protein O6940_01015, partial [Ignavibacteria bacterium]|nr:hypothetical protein [Ignavibacteria bacterium]
QRRDYMAEKLTEGQGNSLDAVMLKIIRNKLKKKIISLNKTIKLSFSRKRESLFFINDSVSITEGQSVY